MRKTSLLAELRSITPKRPLSSHEAYHLAEQQALRFLAYCEVTEPSVPEFIISSLPRFHVERFNGLPTSGASRWTNGRWVVLLNKDEAHVRQRFSLAHEFKHIIDNPYIAYLYPAAPEDVEAIADHFAASLLMPKLWVKRAWYSGIQDIRELSKLFWVSPAAMQLRLLNLGISEPVLRRCGYQPTELVV
jgi:hypothetical protein